ncbi:hypothetical protein KY289_008612 [Solanum tuberosum]|nr:hypothetical protein KY289_008612 [Solanum tuberosum]
MTREDRITATENQKVLNGRLLFEFINKVLVPRIEMRTVASVVDLFHMEKPDELEDISPLPLCWNVNVLKEKLGANLKWQMF